MPEVHLNLHPVNLIIISGIVQCIIISFILFFYREGNKHGNRLFGIFILVCSLNILWPLVVDTNLDELFPEILWIPFSFLLAIGPLQLFYTKSLTVSSYRINKKELILFIPVVIEVLLQLYFILQSVRLNTQLYNVDGFLAFRIAELLAGGVSIVIYGRQSLALIRVHEKWVLENFSNKKDITLLWLHKLINYLRVLWIFWLLFELFFILLWQFQLYYLVMFVLLYILLGIITYSIYWIGIQNLIKTASLSEYRNDADLPVESLGSYSRLSQTEIDAYLERLNTIMQNERLYLHDNLNLRMLAQRLDADPNLLSHLLNNVVHKSFYDYINELRITAVINKLNDPSSRHFKIVEIGYDCGFNSKATFNRVFKKITGKSPTEFRRDLSSENQ
jgi:AraC-like DNA-binding protein